MLSLLGIAGLTLTAWGPEGHSATALIAQRHLTANAAGRVKALLNGRSMASVSSWADATKTKSTAPWHFLNLPLGLGYDDFVKMVKGLRIPNVYNELLRLEADIQTPGIPVAQRQEDLKYIIHLVGDVHQPMHVSREIDRGGGLIKVNYHGETDFHKVWDGLLLKDDQPDYQQLAAKVDHASAAQVQQWQSDDLLKWLWESYQISSKLYTEVHNGSDLNRNYYAAHIKTGEVRLEMGGIRLAGLLNRLFQ
ncbi:MAG TPA: S1/P1 nuclease [Mucilaginibacter sp.]|nr:S1/P1 nuclease [Mucilaginibacter sp.]